MEVPDARIEPVDAAGHGQEMLRVPPSLGVDALPKAANPKCQRAPGTLGCC